MAEHNQTGKKGEEIAIEYLVSKGFEMLETNWHFGKDEIDIIAIDNSFVVFVEVKTRSTNYFGEPEIFVTSTKQKFLIRAANAFIINKNINKEARFDIVTVLLKGDNFLVNHIPDAFYPRL